MEEERKEDLEVQDAQETRDEGPKYRPRPKYQVAAAWVLLAIFLAGVFFWYYWIAYKY